MSEQKHGTPIEWTHGDGFRGETWNPVTGCSKVSPGCANCYAETLSLRFGWSKKPWTPENAAENVVLHPERLDQPLRWRKPRMVFVNSMSDLFHELIPPEFLFRVFDVMEQTPQHTYQVLTKRPERAREVESFIATSGKRWPLPNVWLGVSIENARYTWRADVLREIPAAVRFISAEPLLGSLFRAAHRPGEGASRGSGRESDILGQTDRAGGPGVTEARSLDLSGIDWLIVGGESGHGARPMDSVWARELRDACIEDCALCREGMPRVLTGGGESHGYPPLWWHDDGHASYRCSAHCQRGPAFFFKQWGGRTPKSGGRLLDGREWNEMPA